MATVAVRGTTVGLYPTNPAAEVRYLLDDSGACVHLVEDQEQADKLMVGRGSEGYFSTVFEAKAANGAVLVTGLDLTRKTRNMPESAYLLDQMIRYVVSEEFSPTGAIDPATMLLSQSQGGDAE